MDVSTRLNNALFYVNRLLILGMMACLAITLVQFFQWISPNWEGEYLIPVLILVSLESIFTHRREKSLSMFSPEWFTYRITEWILLLIFLKLSTYLAHGINHLWADLLLWQRDFGQYFLTGEYVLSVFLAFMIWAGSALLSEELEELEGDEGSIRSYDHRGYPVGRAQLRQRLADHILILGAGMIFLTVIVNIDWRNIFPFNRPARIGIANLLFYFLLSLVMLSLTQFSILQAGWLKEKVPFSKDIVRHWTRYTILLTLILAVLASLIPTGYSVSLLTLLNYLISLVIALLQVIWFILSLPIILIWLLLSRLLNSNIPAQPEPHVPVLPNLPPSSPGASLPWLELLKSFMFWLVFIGVIIYSLRYYLQEHPELAGWLRKWRGTRWLHQIWEWLLSKVNGWNRQFVAALRERFQDHKENQQPTAGRLRWISLRRLAPRQQIIFYYGALLRRGGERGFRRQPDQTPLEYSHVLQARLPELDEKPLAAKDITSLTERFIEARYSKHEVTQAHASRARQSWERIRRRMRRIGSS